MITKDEKTKIKQLENLVLDSCLSAGKYIRENAFNITDLKWKKTDDPVTELDKNAEKMIRQHIGSQIDANFYGEEYGIDNTNKNISIYIDPIDGTKSFIRGEYLSSVSIAAEYNKELVVGAVYDFMRDILYYANPEGAYLRQGNTSSNAVVEKKLPCINIALSRPTISFSGKDDEYKKTLDNAGIHINSRRIIGSIALGMAQLAAGSYDGLIMKPYEKEGITDTCDIAAGYFIMKQAGLHIKDYKLRKYDYRKPSNGIVALMPKLAETLSQSSGSRSLGPRVRVIKEHTDHDNQTHHVGEEAFLAYGCHDKTHNEEGLIYTNADKMWPHQMTSRDYFQFIDKNSEDWWTTIHNRI